MKVLITGANGFVGKHLEKCLHDDGHHISAILRKGRKCLFDTTEVHFAQDLNTADYSSIFSSIDAVVHLAALVHQPKQNNAARYTHINCDATLKLAQAALEQGVKKFVFLSSAGVYFNQSPPYSEDLDQVPKTPYAISKLEASRALLDLFSDSGAHLYIVRPNLIYGKGGKGNFNSLSKLISKAPVSPFKRAVSLRSYVNVDNLCSFIQYLIENNCESGIYNISDNHDLSTYELCNYIIKAQNKKHYQFPVPKWIMKRLFSLMGRPDFYNKIYGEFRLNIDKALATGWTPKPIDYRDFLL